MKVLLVGGPRDGARIHLGDHEVSMRVAEHIGPVLGFDPQAPVVPIESRTHLYTRWYRNVFAHENMVSSEIVERLAECYNP